MSLDAHYCYRISVHLFVRHTFDPCINSSVYRNFVVQIKSNRTLLED